MPKKTRQKYCVVFMSPRRVELRSSKAVLLFLSRFASSEER